MVTANFGSVSWLVEMLIPEAPGTVLGLQSLAQEVPRTVGDKQPTPLSRNRDPGRAFLLVAGGPCGQATFVSSLFRAL